MSNDVAPAHINAAGGIDLSTPCSCASVPMAAGRPCPCRCHDSRADRIAKHRRFHVTPAGWCPACQAIEAGSGELP